MPEPLVYGRYLHLPANQVELEDSAYTEKYILPDVRLCVGITNYKVPKINGLYPIFADFGLLKQDLITGDQVARCGFSIDEANEAMLILHTPQGSLPEDMSRRVRGRLLHSDFRNSMMVNMVDIARHMRLKTVRGIAAVRYPSVMSGHLSLERSRGIIDAVFYQNGFLLDERNSFKLALS